MSDASLEPVVFGTAIQAIRNALKSELTPELHAKLRTRGIDLDKIQPAYAMDMWVDVIRIVGTHVFNEFPESTRYVHLGRRFMSGFAETPVGMAAHAISKIIGVRRTLQRMSRNFKQASNYLETDVTDVGAKELRMRTFTHEKFLPRTSDRTTLVTDYRRGVLEEVLTLVGAQGVVEIVDLRIDRQDVTFRITWQ